MDWLKRTASLGLGVALALVLAASAWLHAGVSGDLAVELRQREAVLLTNAIAATLADADEATKAQRLALWKREHPALESARIIISRELQASTVAADEAPRSLRREEKPLFDLAQELRAAAETNVGEGTSRKRTIQVDGTGLGGAITVSAPLLVEDGGRALARRFLLSLALTLGDLLLAEPLAVEREVALRVDRESPLP